jgi:16S rRNA pseudouridine516 synthase
MQVKCFASGTLMLRGEDEPCLPADLSFQTEHCATVRLVEGRYHQVRRMFAACGNHVESLHRTRLGALTLDAVPQGSYCHV